MKIIEIIEQSRRDFIAMYECQHCGHKARMTGYDDDNFHRKVVPDMNCSECGKKAPDDFRPFGTRYPEDMIV